MRLATLLFRLVILVATFASSSAALAAGDEPAAPVGVSVTDAVGADAARPILVTLWYPAAEPAEPIPVGETPVFAGIPAIPDAAPQSGPHPLILISHGGLRSAPNSGAWIGAALARRGFIAAEITGPTIDPARPETIPGEVWRRPGDVSAALSTLLADPDWAPRIDPARIGAVGVYLGGTAVLSLAGGRLRAGPYIRTCANGGTGGTGLDCTFFQQHGIKLADVDKQALEADLTDPRIAAFIAIAPELADVMAPDTLAASDVPLQIIALGPDRGSAGETAHNADPAPLADAASEYHELSTASVFDGFGICKPGGAEILEAEGGGPICREGAGRARPAIHAELVDLIAGFLDWALTDTR